jgi:hypothetical protein
LEKMCEFNKYFEMTICVNILFQFKKLIYV